MPRDPRAYLADIVDACDAVLEFTQGVDLEAYRASKLTRAAVEREMMIVGEAVGSLFRTAPELAERILDGRKIVAFRHRLAHEYAMVDDLVVWVAAVRDVGPLRRVCAELLVEFASTPEAE